MRRSPCSTRSARRSTWDAPDRRRRGRQARRRPVAGRDARQHPPHAAGAEGAARDAVGRRLPLVERAAARSLPALRQPATGAHDHPGRPLRQHRPRRRAREPRRALHRPRALRADRRRSACGRDGDRRQHAAGQPAPARVRVRARGRDRPQEGHDRPQGQHHEGADRHLPRDRRGALRAQVQGPLRARHA